jgi:hypothetical protein
VRTLGDTIKVLAALYVVFAGVFLIATGVGA